MFSFFAHGRLVVAYFGLPSLLCLYVKWLSSIYFAHHIVIIYM